MKDKDNEPKLPIDVQNYLAGLGRKGAKGRAASLSAKERREISRKAARARWAKSKRRKP
jgi:hypothetical protein